MPEIPIPDYNDPKELFAFFGLTYYNTSLLEVSVLNIVVAGQTMQLEGVTFVDVDRLYKNFDKDTFGRIIHKTRDLFEFAEEDEKDLLLALDKRNYLAHKFWVDHAQSLLSGDGRNRMIDELLDILKFLVQLDQRMDVHWKKAWKNLGVTQEWVDNQMQRMRDEAISNDA